MSQLYDEYLQQHRNGVYQAFVWLKENCYEIFGDDKIIADIEYQITYGHDRSKNTPEEYTAYDAYFYGKNRSYEVVQEFRMAWLHHIHCNPHHWQHWVLNNDDPTEGEIILKMPDEYVVEMICDWWSFSFTKGNLYEIFDWYDKHSGYIKLNPETKETVEKILSTIREKLDKMKKEKPNEPDLPPELEAMAMEAMKEHEEKPDTKE